MSMTGLIPQLITRYSAWEKLWGKHRASWTRAGLGGWHLRNASWMPRWERGKEREKERENQVKSHKYNRSEFGRALWMELTATESFSLLPVVRSSSSSPFYKTHVAFEKTVAYRRNCDATRTCDYFESERDFVTRPPSLSLSFLLSLSPLFSFSRTRMDYHGAVWDELQVQ